MNQKIYTFLVSNNLPPHYFTVLEDRKLGYLTYLNLMNILYKTYNIGKDLFNININSPYIQFEYFGYEHINNFKPVCENIFVTLYLI